MSRLATLRRRMGRVRGAAAVGARVARWTAVAVLLLGVSGAAAWQWRPAIAARTIDHAYFRVEQIVVTPTERFHAGALLAAAGVAPGVSIWRVAPGAVAEALEAHPWVRRAAVRRELPRRLVVEVRERRPAAIVLLDDLYYVDRRGEPFARLAPREPLTLPLVTGIETALLARDDRAARRSARRAIGLLRLLADRGLALEVSEVHIDAERGITVFPVAPKVGLVFGWTRLGTKVERLGAVLAALRGRQATVEEIDLNFDAEAVIRMEQTGRGGGLGPLERAGGV